MKFGHFIPILEMSFQKSLAHESSSNSCHEITFLKNATLSSDSLDEALPVFSFSGSAFGIKRRKYGIKRNAETGEIKFEALKPHKALMC
jgi:hypothetical protein